MPCFDEYPGIIFKWMDEQQKNIYKGATTMKYHIGDKIHSIEELRDSWAEEPDRWYESELESKFKVTGFKDGMYYMVRNDADEHPSNDYVNGRALVDFGHYNLNPYTIIPDPNVQKEHPKVDVKPGQVWEFVDDKCVVFYFRGELKLMEIEAHGEYRTPHFLDSLSATEECKKPDATLTDRRVTTISRSEEIVEKAELARLRAIEAKLRELAEEYKAETGGRG